MSIGQFLAGTLTMWICLDSRPSGSFYVDRVRLIYVAGYAVAPVEGWVMEYGLGDP